MGFAARILIVLAFLAAMAVVWWVIHDLVTWMQFGFFALIAIGFFWAIWLEGGRRKNDSDE